MSDQSKTKTESPMTQTDAARIQSAQARGGGDMSSKGFAARAQAAGDRNASTQAGATKTSGNNGRQK
ncbi:hypothetical protein H2203_005174 [Taxawa tesnikishii (nom. ined.)]|nr:hypothetical protein H2203_005174 [Dothideales sp. JES 119]